MGLHEIAAGLLVCGAAGVVGIYHLRMNRLPPGDRERVTHWPAYVVVDWYLQLSTIGFGVAAIVGSHWLLLEFHNHAGLLVAGLLTAAAGLALFAWAMWNLDRQYTPAHAAHLPSQIVTTGPYRFIRHPVYAANLLMTAGVLLASGSLWLAVNLGILCAYYRIAMTSEENSILSRFPEYRDYIARTGRIFPRLPGVWRLISFPATNLTASKTVVSNE